VSLKEVQVPNSSSCQLATAGLLLSGVTAAAADEGEEDEAVSADTCVPDASVSLGLELQARITHICLLCCWKTTLTSTGSGRDAKQQRNFKNIYK